MLTRAFISTIFCIFVLISQVFSRPNIVFVLTDDQDLTLGSLNYMKKTLNLIANQGATLSNYYVNSPICCPSRSSLLTGRHLHNIDVYNNSIAGGCSSRQWQRTHEQNTIATGLKLLGYTTFYAGKYLNQYGDKSAGGIEHVPPGYDHWYGLKGNSVYYNYTLSVNGVAKKFRDNYLTDVIGKYAVKFLRNHGNEPFFMMLAPPAAHAPFQPAKRHRHDFPQVMANRALPFNVTPIDKHWLVSMPPTSLPVNVDVLDSIQRDRVRTLQSVDDLIEALVRQLEQLNVLNNTYVIFSSDNGFHIGQFTQPWDKRQPYESDVHVPFLIRGPGIKTKSLLRQPMAGVDVAPTILDLAGFKMADVDGESMKKYLIHDVKTSKKSILIEYWGEGDDRSVNSDCHFVKDDQLAECSTDNWCKCQDSRNNTYQCLLDFTESGGMLKFCKFPYDFYEVYNLTQDPYELFNARHKISGEQFDYYQQKLDFMAHT